MLTQKKGGLEKFWCESQGIKNKCVSFATIHYIMNDVLSIF